MRETMCASSELAPTHLLQALQRRQRQGLRCARTARMQRTRPECLHAAGTRLAGRENSKP
jgi:hypothetical protein